MDKYKKHGYIINKDIDCIIVKFVIRFGHPKQGRYLNLIVIIFGSDYTGFITACYKHYWNLLCRYKNIKRPGMLFAKPLYKLNKGEFWRKAREDFKTGNTVIFEEQKGHTRRKLYMLGLYHGYSYTITGQERVERRTRYAADIECDLKIIKTKLYTMIELMKQNADYPQLWIATEQKRDGEILYQIDGYTSYR